MVRTEVPSLGVDGARRAPERKHLWVAVAVGAVWLSIGAISIWSPDLVSGSEQDHLPIAAYAAWLWGAIATGLILLAAGVGEPSERSTIWRGFALVMTVIWAVIAIASIASPVLETGTDPTRVPIAALLAPVAGVGATAFVCVYVAGMRARTR